MGTLRITQPLNIRFSPSRFRRHRIKLQRARAGHREFMADAATLGATAPGIPWPGWSAVWYLITHPFKAIMYVRVLLKLRAGIKRGDFQR